jgi:hypothetical protein
MAVAAGKLEAGELAMSASIIAAVAADRRYLCRVPGMRALCLLPALLLGLQASALFASEAQPYLEKNSFYLSSAGFHIQLASDPAGQKGLRTLPPHQFVVDGVGDARRYLYAEPQHCVCIFVGDQQAYDRYRKILSQPLRPAADVSPDYKTQAGVLLSNQPLRQSTRGDPTTLSDYLSTLRPSY